MAKGIRPLFLVALFGFAVFGLESDDLGTRLSILAALFLTTYAVQWIVIERLPRLPFSTVLDHVAQSVVTALLLMCLVSLASYRLGRDGCDDDGCGFDRKHGERVDAVGCVRSRGLPPARDRPRTASTSAPSSSGRRRRAGADPGARGDICATPPVRLVTASAVAVTGWSSGRRFAPGHRGLAEPPALERPPLRELSRRRELRRPARVRGPELRARPRRRAPPPRRRRRDDRETPRRGTPRGRLSQVRKIKRRCSCH